MVTAKHPTIDATLIHAYIRDAEVAMELNPLLQKCGITPQALITPGSRISFDKVAKLLNRVRMVMGDEEHGRFERPVPPGYFRLMMLAMINTQTVTQALARMFDYFNVMTKALEFRLHRNGQQMECEVIEHVDIKVVGCGTLDLHLSAIVRIVSWLGNQVVRPTLVRLSFPAPPYRDEYRYLYYDASVMFEQRSCSLSFNAEALDQKIMQNEASVKKYLRYAPRDLFFPRYFAGNTSETVHQLMTNHLTEQQTIPTQDQLADVLQCSPQTLRRRLADEGTNLHDIKLQVRRDIAIHHLSNHMQSVEAVAEVVGYTEASNFVRAFKAWTGMTPLQFRKRL